MNISSITLPGSEGCEPKTPSVLNLNDIKERVKDLSKSIKKDPRMAKDPECVDEIPLI